MRIFLIGLPGSGKTTLGRMVAQQLSVPYVDLDDEIERVKGRPVRNIFEREGESAFRETEHDLLKTWCEVKDSFVMATGGGTPCFFNNMSLMNASGKSIFLDVSPPELAKRIIKSGLVSRPLFSKETPSTLERRIGRMRKDRLPFYQQAELIVSNDNLHFKDLEEALKGDT